FTSLALDRGEFSARVVLSGGNSDGTLGIKAIKEQGGLTLAQSADGFGPSSPEMPGSAIATGLVDFVVPADQMGVKLVDFAAGLGHLDELDDAASQGPERGQLEAAKHEIYAILRTRIGHDFSGYKSKTFMRRVQRRMHVNQIPAIGAYVEFLKQNGQEAGALFRDLLISVTNFFRDAEAFESLQNQVIPELLKDRGATETIRLWVPGCATGVTNAVDADVAMRFCIEIAKLFGQGAMTFSDDAEWAALQARYGSMAHLQTVGREPGGAA
ncbi:MAG: DUF1177 family protein, partial [Achromobacter sp.]|nr:DUF1177 family protein [Achromobacter sp.]